APVLVEPRDELGEGEDRVLAQPARHGAGMAGLPLAHDALVADVAADAGDDRRRPFARHHHRALLDVQLEEGGDVALVDEGGALPHLRDVDADTGERLREAARTVALPQVEVLRVQRAEQDGGADVGLAEPGRFLAAQADDAHRPRRRDPLTLHAREHHQPGEHAGRSVQVAPAGHGIEVRADEDVGARRLVGQRDDEVVAGIARGDEPLARGEPLHHAHGRRLALGKGLAGDADPVEAELAQLREDLDGERLPVTLVAYRMSERFHSRASASSGAALPSTTAPTSALTSAMPRRAQKAASPSMISIIAMGPTTAVGPTRPARAP